VIANKKLARAKHGIERNAIVGFNQQLWGNIYVD